MHLARRRAHWRCYGLSYPFAGPFLRPSGSDALRQSPLLAALPDTIASDPLPGDLHPCPTSPSLGGPFPGGCLAKAPGCSHRGRGNEDQREHEPRAKSHLLYRSRRGVAQALARKQRAARSGGPEHADVGRPCTRPPCSAINRTPPNLHFLRCFPAASAPEQGLGLVVAAPGGLGSAELPDRPPAFAS